MSTLKTGALRGTSGTADSIQLHASDQSVTFPGNVTVSGTMTGGGKILQVAAVSKTDTDSTDSADWNDISGMSVSMTPASGTKILVNVSVNWGADVRWGVIRLLRDSTVIAAGTSPSNREAVLFQCAGTDNVSNNEETLFNNSFMHLDTHGANGSTAVTYKLQWQVSYSSGNTIYLNRSHNDSDASFCSRGSSSIVLQEVG